MSGTIQKTVPQIHIKDVPSSDLSPLDVEKRDERVEGLGFEVLFEGTVLGTIPENIARRNTTLRWHDVVFPTLKRKRETIPEHQKSLLLFEKLPYSSSSKPEFFETPFPYGADSIEDLAMTGQNHFKHSYQLYNHWFREVSPMDRLNRAVEQFDATTLTTEELKTAEKRLKQLWVETHQILMKRL